MSTYDVVNDLTRAVMAYLTRQEDVMFPRQEEQRPMVYPEGVQIRRLVNLLEVARAALTIIRSLGADFGDGAPDAGYAAHACLKIESIATDVLSRIADAITDTGLEEKA